VEHSIDEIHNYDDSNLKGDIAGLSGQLTDIINSINSIHSDIDAVTTRLNGITSTTAKIKLANPKEIKMEVYADENQTGSAVQMTTAMIYMVNQDTSANAQDTIAIGGASSDSGINIASAQKITLTNNLLNHYVRIKNTINEISDVNGLVFSFNDTGYTVKTLDSTKSKTTPWT
jgi:hypothetical protein